MFWYGKHVLDGCTDADMTCDINFKKFISGYLMTFVRGSFIAIKSLRIKFDIISKYYDIFKFFTTSGKCFQPKIKGKHFPENQAKFSFDRKVFSVDQLF